MEALDNCPVCLPLKPALSVVHVYLSYCVFVCMQISHVLQATKCLNK